MKSGCNSAEELIEWLPLFKPAIKCIVVEKHRSRCSFLYRDIPVQIEIAELTTPVAICSIAIECEARQGVGGDKGLGFIRDARDLLGLPDSFEVMGYVQFLDRLVKDHLS